MIKNTGGKWLPQAWPKFFIASNCGSLRMAAPVNKDLLVAVNELKNAEDLQTVHGFIEDGCDVLIDSGVFWLSTQHARAHGLTMDQALALAPEEIDGFEALWASYVSLVKEVGDRAWGYIEIDQGGKANKIKLRKKLEAIGLKPIPVYHPLVDGWDYFDYLAQRYDRICFGNVVQANVETRKRLLATAWERRRKYPHLWIHMLGLFPNELTNSWPCNSCDSSSWLVGVRWGHMHAVIENKVCWNVGLGFVFKPGEVEDGSPSYRKAIKVAGYDAHFNGLSMNVHANEYAEVLGCDVGLFI